MSASADELLGFWFGADLDSPAAVAERSRLWFGGGAETDHEIRARFADLPDRAVTGALDDWLEAPRSSLALVIALDQLPRNLFRGSARAFAYDARAVEVTSAALDAGFDRVLHPLEAGFFYLPFEHAERLDLQEKSVALFEALRARGPAPLRPTLDEWLAFARRHRDVIARFGRFPHRNTLLARFPTAAERAHLAPGGERFGGGEMEGLRARREAVVRRHMEAENVHDFETVMQTFAHPRYEIVATGQVHDGDAAVRQYFRDTRTAFPDQRNELIALWHASLASGSLRGASAELGAQQEPLSHASLASGSLRGASGELGAEREPLAADDAVVVEFWLMGTHRGPLAGVAPTGRSFRVRMAALFLFEGAGDRIICERVYFDTASLLRQLTT